MNIEHMHRVGQEARTWGQEHYPDASPQHHAAFANSVVYALFRMTGPYGGPSVREHIASALLNNVLIEWQDVAREEVYLFLVSPCYGALTGDHLRFWMGEQKICHDDDPDDVRILQEQEKRYKFSTTRVWTSTLDKMREVARLREESIVQAWDRLATDELARLHQTE